MSATLFLLQYPVVADGTEAIENLASSKPISVSHSKSFPTSIAQPRSKHNSPASGSFRASSIGKLFVFIVAFECPCHNFSLNQVLSL